MARKLGWDWNRPIPGRALFVITFLVMIGMLVYALKLASNAQRDTRAEARASTTALCIEISNNHAILLRKSRRDQRIYVAISSLTQSPQLKQILLDAAREEKADEAFLANPETCKAVLKG